MRISNFCSLPFLSGIIVFLSLIILLRNEFTYQFSGNNFFPEHMFVLTSILVLVNCGLVLLFGIKSKISRRGIELFYLFIIMSVIALATNAVQLTPFATIDKKILDIEHYFHIDLPGVIAWTNAHPYFRNILGFIYDTLPYQMSILPLIVIITGKFSLVKEYYFLMLITTLIGFTLYYFFPTTAPASVINSPLFMPEQIATGLKFNQIHHHITPSTNEGGLIALPSYHTIWALLCVYLLKDWVLPCIVLFSMNILLIASCVLLGWHYVTDVVAAIVLTAMAFALLPCYKKASN